MGNIYEAECLGKTPYVSKAKALARIRCQMREKRRVKKLSGWAKEQTLTAYRCPHCRYWHVGSTSRKLGHTRCRPPRWRRDDVG